MKNAETLARVILRSDGFVHIAFPDIRSIWATAENIMDLFSDPIEFIETGISIKNTNGDRSDEWRDM